MGLFGFGKKDKTYVCTKEELMDENLYYSTSQGKMERVWSDGTGNDDAGYVMHQSSSIKRNVSFARILQDSGPEIANDKEIINFMLDRVDAADSLARGYYYSKDFLVKGDRETILRNMGDELKQDKAFILSLIKRFENSHDKEDIPSISTYISNELLQDPDFIIKAMQYKEDILDLLPTSSPIFRDKEFMEFLLEKDTTNILRVPSDFINNPENLDYIYKAIDKGVHIKTIIDKVDFSQEGMDVLRTQLVDAFRNTEIGKDYDDKLFENKYMAIDTISSVSSELRDVNKLNMTPYLEEFNKNKEKTEIEL